MKKIIAAVLAIVLCFSITACSSGNKKAFEKSKEAYENIDFAYEIIEQFGSDIYDAWFMGIYHADELTSNGVKRLASELYLSENEVKEGAARACVEYYGDSWDEMSESDKELTLDGANFYFYMLKDEMFTFCVMTVLNAYEASGKITLAQNALDSAKMQMKELSEKYSDFEHYPNLKGYYATTSSFFDFCLNPTVSFEQAKETINDYKNEARDYISDLDYIFEE